MSERRFVALEAVLRRTGEVVDYPEQPAVASRVVDRLESGGAERVAGPPPRRYGRMRVAVASVVLLTFIVSGVLAASPDARRAVADWLGISGVRIERGDGVTTPGTSPTPKALDLGEEVSLPEVRAATDFPVLVPRALGSPDSVHLDTGAVGEVVHLAYEARPGLPAAEATELGLLMTAFEARVGEGLIKKVALEGTAVTPVQLGDLGYWIAGDPHTLLFLDESGRVLEDQTRLAGNVLLWEKDGVSYRIESSLGKMEALAVARSAMEPK